MASPPPFSRQIVLDPPRDDLEDDQARGRFASPASTIEDDLDLELEIKRLIRIRPEGEHALMAFSRLCESLDTQPVETKLEHHRQFVVMGPLVQLRSLLQDSGSCSSFSSDSGALHAGSVPDLAVRTGYFEITFDTTPLFQQIGWTLGKGRRKIPNASVDLLLPDAPKLYGVHAAFRFNTGGVLTLHALRALSVDGKPVSQGQSHALSKSIHRISIDNLHFQVEYCRHPALEDAKQGAKKKYLQGLGYDTFSLHPLVTATPSDNAEIVGKWVLHGITGQGQGGVTVEAATNTESGTGCALKRLVRHNATTATRVDNEVRRHREIEAVLADNKSSSPGKGHLLRLRHIVYSAQPVWTEGDIDKVYIISSPLCLGDFQRLVLEKSLSEITIETRRALWSQSLLGLAYLHSQQLVHRDIKPANLGIKSLVPPMAIILDLGTAVSTVDDPCVPRPGTCGTIGFLAPELENAAYASNGRYGTAVDVFSIAVVGQMMLLPAMLPMACRLLAGPTGNRNPFKPPVRDEEVRLLRNLCTRMQEDRTQGLSALLGRMLNEYPTQRGTAMQAATHESLRNSIEPGID